MSFFESEYFLTSSNDEVGNGGEESSTYPITDSLLESGGDGCGVSRGDLMEEGDLLGVTSNSANGRGSYDIGAYNIDQSSLLMQTQSSTVGLVPSSTTITTSMNDTRTSIGGIQQQQSSPVVSFSRANFKPSYLGASTHLGRSSAIASMMGVSGMPPTTPRIGGVRAVVEADDEDDRYDEYGEAEGVEGKGKAKKSHKTKRDKKEKTSKKGEGNDDHSDKDKNEVAGGGKTEKKKKEKKERRKKEKVESKQTDNDEENIHPVISNAQDENDQGNGSNITRLDLEECVDNLCSEESVQWNMKTWVAEVGTRLGFDVGSRPDMKNTLREIVLERAMAYVPNTQSQSQEDDYISMEVADNYNENHDDNGNDNTPDNGDNNIDEDYDQASEKSDDSSYSLGPKRKTKAKVPRKPKALTTTTAIKSKKTRGERNASKDDSKKKKSKKNAIAPPLVTSSTTIASTSIGDNNENIENQVASMAIEDDMNTEDASATGGDKQQLLPDEDDLSSVKSDSSDSSFDSSDSEDSIASGEILRGDIRGKRQATKDQRLKKKTSTSSPDDDSNVTKVKVNDELETFKKLESGNTEGLVSAAEVLNNQKDSEEIEWASRKLTKAALRQLTAGDRDRMLKTKQEAVEAKQYLIEFCNKKGYELHSDYIKDVIKHNKLDPTAWRGTAWQGPGEIETYLFEDDETLMEGHDEYDVIEEIARIDEDELEGMEEEEEEEELEIVSSSQEANEGDVAATENDITTSTEQQDTADTSYVTATTQNDPAASAAITPSPFMLAQMQQKIEQDQARAEMLRKQQQEDSLAMESDDPQEAGDAVEQHEQPGNDGLDGEANEQSEAMKEDNVIDEDEQEEDMIEMSDDSDDEDSSGEELHPPGATEKIYIGKDKLQTLNQGSPDSLIQVATDSPSFSQQGHISHMSVKKSLFDDTPSTIQTTLMNVNIPASHSRALLSGLKNMGMKKVVTNNPRAQAKAKLMLEAMKQSNMKKEERWKKNNEGWIHTWSIEENMRVENALSKLLALYMQKTRLHEENELLRAEKREQERMIRLAENEARWRAAAELGDDDEAEFDADAPILARRYANNDDNDDDDDGKELDEEEQLAKMAREGSNDDDDDDNDNGENDMLIQENLDDASGRPLEEDTAPDGVSGSTQLDESQTQLVESTQETDHGGGAGEESDDEKIVVKHATTVTYGKKVIINDDDIDRNENIENEHKENEKEEEEEEEEEEEKEQIPEDPIERAKYERKKALARSQAYRLAVLEEERKNKKTKKSSFFEDEAEEEDEEGLMGGLEDYGFGSNKKDDDADDEKGALKMRADDFANIVDDLSDDEGDEDAGDAARAKADLKRDQQQTKAVIDAVIYGKDKFKNLRNQGAILNEDEKVVAMRNNDGESEPLDDEMEEFDDEAYYLQKMKVRDEELQKEAEKQRLRELEEEEAEAEEAENVNVAEMNEDERRQHEVDKLIHNKIAKEFQMKARMKAKMRKAVQREKMLKEAQAAAAGVQLPDEQPMSELLTRKLAQMNGENPNGAGAFSSSSYRPPSLHRSSSMGATSYGAASRNKSGSIPSRASSMKSTSYGGNRIGMNLNTNFDTMSSGPPSLNRQNSFSSTGSGPQSSRSGSSDENLQIDESAFLELNNSLSIMNNSGYSNGGFPKPLPLKRSSSYSNASESSNHGFGTAPASGLSGQNPSSNAAAATSSYKSSMYKGTLNQEELDGGYGLGMALTKKRKEELQSTQAQHASLFSAVTSNGGKMPAALSRSMSASAGGGTGKALKRIRPTSSTVTVNNRSFVFGTDNSRTGFGNTGGSMSGFGAGEDSSMGISRSASTSAANGPSLFSKIADAANKKDHLLKKSSSLVGMRNF